MHPNARKIKTEIGPYCSSNELRTVEIEWFPKFPKIQKFFRDYLFKVLLSNLSSFSVIDRQTLFFKNILS